MSEIWSINNKPIRDNTARTKIESLEEQIENHNHDDKYLLKDAVINNNNHVHENIEVLNNITNDKITEWNNKSNFSGNYEDLINKPDIPSVEGLAKEETLEQIRQELTGKITELLEKMNQIEVKLDTLISEGLPNDPEPDPEPEPEPVYYAITYNIANCTSTNNIKTIEEGKAYTCEIAPNSEYEIKSIVVTMKGIDITSNVVTENSNKRVINIAEVTGAIIITVVAELIEEEPPEVGVLKLSVTTMTLTEKNETKTLYASYNNELIVAASADWISSNAEVATVSGSGVVTALTNGSTVITCTYNGLEATCNVTVDIEESSSGGGGETVTGEIILEPKSMTITRIGQSMSILASMSDGSTGTFTWESNNTAVATVNKNGVVTSVGDGECIITCRNGSLSARCLIDVVTNIPCTSVAISQPTLSFDFLGIKKTLTGMVSPENCTETPTWSSDNKEVATVNNIGKVTSVGPGQCTITFACGSKSETCIVTVAENAIAGGEHIVTPKASLSYTNPEIVMEGVKAKVTQNGISQYFDVSYIPNPGHSKYINAKEIMDSNGHNYYLAMLSEGTSSFGQNGYHYDSGGWFKCVDIYGEAYEATNVPYAIYNNVTDYTVKNVNIATPIIQKALDNFNQTLPAINVTIDNESNNYIHRIEIQDTMFAVCRFRGAMFYIEVNETTMLPTHGETASTETEYNENDNNWTSIIVHEFGHLLGTADHATHVPTIYDYTIDTTRCMYLQPNDIEYIKFMWKREFDVDIQTYQDLGASANPLSNINKNIFADKVMDYEYKPTDCFSYMQIDNEEEESDVIVNGTLKYNRTEELDVGSVFEYHIYDIIPNDIEKGELINKELKVIASQNIEIKDNVQYKLYLKQYDNCPCSLIHPHQGIKEI